MIAALKLVAFGLVLLMSLNANGSARCAPRKPGAGARGVVDGGAAGA